VKGGRPSLSRRAFAAGPGGGGVLALTSLLLAVLLGGCGGTKAVCEPDPSYAGRQDGEPLRVPEGLDPPATTGRYAIPPIAEQPAGEVDPRCTAFPPQIAGMAEEKARAERRRQAERQRSAEAAAAATAVGGSATSPRQPPVLPSASGQPVDGGTELYAAVYDLVAEWSSAWQSRRLDDYLDTYADSFQPPAPMRRAQWEAAREQRMQEGAQARVDLDTLEVYQGENGPVARFQERFEFEGIESDITKEMRLVREDGRWRIAAEEVIDVR
jgi:hypothetical protein